MDNQKNKVDLYAVRERIGVLCHEMSSILTLINERMSADPSFVFSAEYTEMKQDLKDKSEELQCLKSVRAELQHCYRLLIKGDVLHEGKVLHDHHFDYELTSVIDCNLGSSTALNNTLGTHKALWSVICNKFGSMFVNRKLRVDLIVQLR
jgi:hypothetical protein